MHACDRASVSLARPASLSARMIHEQLHLCKRDESIIIGENHWTLSPSCHVLLTWVWSLWREDAKIKATKNSSVRVNGGSAKFCTSKNFPLYGTFSPPLTPYPMLSPSASGSDAGADPGFIRGGFLV